MENKVDSASPLDITVSPFAEVIEGMEREAFEEFVAAPPFEYRTERMTELSAWPGNYRSIAVQLAWESWKARAAHQRPCRGKRHAGCDYLAACGSVCDKCGQIV